MKGSAAGGTLLTRRVLIPLSLCLALVMGTASAGAAEPSLSVLGTATTPLTVSGEKGKDTAETHLALFNENPRHTKIEVRFEAASDESVHVKSVAPRRLPAGEVTRVAVAFEGLADIHEAVSGELVISGGPDPIAQSVEVTPAPQPDLPWPPLIIGISLLLAAFVAVLAACCGLPKGKRKAHLHDPSPGAKWEAKSWATTLTALGGLLGTVLGGITFPPYPEQISKEVLTNLNLFFAALVVVGPFLFQILRRKTLTKDELKAERTGTKLTMLTSATVTQWAVFGQLGAFALLFWELLSKEKVLAWIVVAVLFGLGAGAGRYFLRTMCEALKRDWPTEEKEAKAKRRKRRRKHQKEQALAILKAQGEAARKAGAAQPAVAVPQLAAEVVEKQLEEAEADPEAAEESEPQTMALL